MASCLAMHVTYGRVFDKTHPSKSVAKRVFIKDLTEIEGAFRKLVENNDKTDGEKVDWTVHLDSTWGSGAVS